ncbi:hypothetical protein LGM89_08020 [Burkholderia sp. AU31624]|uniref:hypothetical protein n=1 Tax=Burkholderia sp. AU31624 TaxID=2879629 RepID=UPI001CF3BA5C|nr:hypothetical protein [Burkholderia sp. AU31624]MCA8253204.1 hypothetical protein [Burkholderia sp. AU31624]
MKIKNITTKIRPIKKLFILGKNDFESLFKIISEISREIDAAFNLILPDDELLWSDITQEFIARHDPDLIFNFSQIDNERLKSHFDVVSVTPNDGQWKIAKFGTQLMSFTHLPKLAERFGVTLPARVYAANHLDTEPRCLFNAINFGFVRDPADLHWENSIFSSVSVEPVPDDKSIDELIFDRDSNFLTLSSFLGTAAGQGSSVYEKDFNLEKYFHKGRCIFVTPADNISGIAYFWNMRATHGWSEISWVPLELAKSLKDLAVDFEAVVFVDDFSQESIVEIFPSDKLLRLDRYYFSGANDRWKNFEHNQVIALTDRHLTVHHPQALSFSDIGIGGAFVMEVRGLTELSYPARASSWKLFEEKSSFADLFAHKFRRISRFGLACYCLDLSFNHSDLFVSFDVPGFCDIINNHFSALCLEASKTNKSSLLEQLLSLMGGVGGVHLISSETIFSLLMSMTPTVRTEKAIQKIIGGASNGDATERIMELVSQARGSGALVFPEISHTAEELSSKASIKKKDKPDFFIRLQKLYDRKIFLRGKNFPCMHCGSRIWIPLESIQGINYCPECGNETSIPVHNEGIAANDYFRLNQLIVRAADQGQLATALTVNFFAQQNYRVFDFISNLEIRRLENTETDIDLILRIGMRLGVAECKTYGGFDECQIQSLLEMACLLKYNFAVFSSLLPSKSGELMAVEDFIRKMNVKIPVFILSAGAIFSPENFKIGKYFEAREIRGDFPSGPIILG